MERKISKTSKKIVDLLKKGTSSRKIESMGFSRSTIRYYRYKLFNAPKHLEVLRKISEYNRARHAKNK